VKEPSILLFQSKHFSDEEVLTA